MSSLLLIVSLIATGAFLVALFRPAPFTHKLEGKRVRTLAGSSIIDRGYFGMALWLFVLAVLYCAAALALLAETGSTIGMLVAIGLAALAGFALLLAAIRIFVFPETRYLNSHKLLANHTYFTLPHDIFPVYTEDGVLIRSMSMIKEVQTQGKEKHTQAIVLCHAGFRTMNTLADVAIAEWLFDDFDVFAFDLRGHGNSGGWYSGDGKTCLDLKAVLQHIKTYYHYDKIGLMGRSIGAWTIIMKEAREPEADSILAAALPNHQIRDCPPLTPLYPIFVNNRPGNVVARIARGLRPRPYDVGDDPWKVIERISPTPLLMVYCEEDRFLGMSREKGMQDLFERAREPKRIVYLPGEGHVYEVHLLHKYYMLARDWFKETLK